MFIQQSRQEQLLKLGAMLTLVIGVALFLQNLYLWFRFHVNIPVTDQAYILPLMQSVVEQGFFSVSISDWIAPHSGAHRIAVTRLLMSIDYLFLNGQNHVLYFLTWASILTLLLVMLKAFKEGFGSEKALVPFVAGITLAFLSSRSQLWNVVNPINSSWFITFAAGALSFACITSRTNAPNAWQFFAVYLMAALAAFSTFSGVLVWLILPLFIAIRSPTAGVISAFISGVFVALYISGVSTDLDNLPDAFRSELEKYLPSEPISLFEQQLRLVSAVFKNTLVFLGSPLSITNPRLATWMVITSIVIVVFSWLALLSSWQSGRQNHNAWTELNLAVATLCAGTATAANLGRTILTTPAADRYQTVVMMYWLSICGLILGFGLKRYKDKRLGLLACMTLCIAVSIVFLANPSFPITTSLKLYETANRASALDTFGVSGKYLYLSVWRGEYLSEFHTFFDNNKLAHRASEDRQLRIPDSFTDCPNVELNITRTQWPGIVLASASIEEPWMNWHRKFLISNVQGEALGYLFPSTEDTPAKSRKDMKSRSREVAKIASTPDWQRKNIWTGYLKTTIKPKERVYLHYRSFTQADSSCGITVSGPPVVAERR